MRRCTFSQVVIYKYLCATMITACLTLKLLYTYVVHVFMHCRIIMLGVVIVSIPFGRHHQATIMSCAVKAFNAH